MNNKGIKIKLKKNERIAVTRLKEALRERFNLLDFRVFGSKARGDASQDSDIDIMIKNKRERFSSLTLCEVGHGLV